MSFNFKPTFLFILVVLQVAMAVAQDTNVFLNRDFWKSQPTVDDIKAKIDKGTDIAQLNGYGFDAVVYAILEQVPNSTIKYMLSIPGNGVNKLTHDGRTYIFWGAYKGNIELMEYLLKQGAKTDITDDKGNTILNFAASTGQQNTKVYDICLANGNNLEKDLNSDGANALLLVAPYIKNNSLLEYFTSKELDINSTDKLGNGIFNYAAKSGNINLLESLISKGVNYKSLNKENGNAMLFAAKGTRGNRNGIEIYEFLEKQGINPNVITSSGTTPLHILARNGKIEVISYFLEKEVNANQADADGNTAFILASSANDLAIVKVLHTKIKDINTTNKKGQSALTMAVENNSLEVISFLIKNRANINIVDSKGNTLMYYLIESYSPRSVNEFQSKLSVLSDNGVKINTTQADGNTLFHLAVEKQDVNLLELINGFGIDVNATNNNGLTPLQLAAMTAKDAALIKYLISIGADKSVVTDFGETLFDLAQENEKFRDQSTIEFLK